METYGKGGNGCESPLSPVLDRLILFHVDFNVKLVDADPFKILAMTKLQLQP